MGYERFYLRENPFIEDSLDFPLINRRGVMRDTARHVSEYIDAQAPGILAILGDYGIGKTFTLISIQKRLAQGTFLEEGSAIVRPIYLKALPIGGPARYMTYIYRTVVAGLGTGEFLSILREARLQSREEDIGVGRVLESIDPDLANAIIRLDSSLKQHAWSYLQAEKVSASMLKKLGVSSRIESEEKAQNMLLEILRLLAQFDRQGVLLLIDEWEYVFTAVGPSRQIQLHNSFKELYDRIQESKVRGETIAPAIFIFACTPTAWQENIPGLMRKVGPGGIEPFWQRIARTYNLPPFKGEETKELITSRLGERRTSRVDDPLFPFSEDSVSVIHEYGQGVPRRILKRSAFLLEQALVQERDNIDASFARSELDEYEYV